MKKFFRKTIVNIAGLTGVWVLSSSLNAASFDCAKAATNIEKLICSDQALSQLDSDLAGAYKSALEKTDNKDALKQQQRMWLKEKRNACTKTACLTQTYQDRVNELNAITSGNTSPSNPLKQNSGKNQRFKLALGEQYQLCKDFLDLRNRVPENAQPNCGITISFDDIAKKQGFKEIPWVELNIKEHKELIRNHTIYDSRNPDEAKIKKINEKFDEWFKNTTARLWQASFDINHDGKNDKVFKVQYRNCDSTSEIIVGRDDGVLDELTYARNISGEPFFYKGMVYVGGGNAVSEGFGMETYVSVKTICQVLE